MDKNLKLLVLDQLYDEDKDIKASIDAIKAMQFQELIYGAARKYDWYDLIPEVAERLEAIELPDEKLVKVKFLSGEALDIHFMVMPNWDGEGDEFKLKSFEGIDRLTSLKEIECVDFEGVEKQDLLLKLQLKEIDESYCELDEDVRERLIEMGVRLS
ncbi:hypothetical protein MO867_17735 [Microbulbifer sp. OS29]|uniref:DUF6892 domain-containing protein n=1 Tax=Microbulbifer okhotskensis TaxID=2926617 RepID=A0A9X2EQX1_9GAMM|nr:hypothetical protein [Microbulbifer okhotskensis]MCO1336176.1 hypothetical protein [Microbulbifer okhotskensis]